MSSEGAEVTLGDISKPDDADHGSNDGDASGRTDIRDPDRLSTIPEGNEMEEDLAYAAWSLSIEDSIFAECQQPSIGTNTIILLCPWGIILSCLQCTLASFGSSWALLEDECELFREGGEF